MVDDAALRERLRVLIKSSASEIWSPWYVLGHVPDEDADLFADVALRRWRSRGRRSSGRHDPVRDLGKGFSQSRRIWPPPGEGMISHVDKDDHLRLAAALAEVLRDT